ncbi:pPIWI_RE module domain-containing protein [Streptomyces sp. LaPpAH-108]|uniref:pPIWI_RE module domain-containing protein n=1 Tax=Streptomyces sp. LaPpAH-108 TaxID=1155714 RepID=UPI000364F089|nr:DUF3962 domain-containing protein [Streptomyces sp. LaPpAH-108]
MKRYETIRLARYAPAPKADWTSSYHTLPLPEFHRKRLLHLYRLGLKRPDTCRSVPVGRLNSLLQALAPEVISVAKWIDVTRDEPWLYARTPVPRDVLSALLTTWVHDLRPESEHRQAVREALRELRFSTLRWEKRSISLLSSATTPGGTAHPPDLLYQLLPDALADRVLGLPEPFTYEGGTFAFHRVARRPGDRGAELLSWPPGHHIDRDGQTWYFSALLTATLQSVPFSSDLLIHVRSGVRRWATQTGQHGLYLPPRRATSVYMLSDAPWLGDSPGNQPSAGFSVSRLRYDSELGAHCWENGGPEGMLTRLRLSRPLPAPSQLLRSPEGWLRRADGLTAAIVHSTAMGSHGVKAGLMPGDRVPLMQWFEQALPEGLMRVPDNVRADRYLRSRRRPRRGNSPADRKAEELATLRQEVAAALGGEPLRLEFLWLTEPNRDAGVQALRTVLGLTKETETVELDEEAGRAGEVVCWRTSELMVELRLTRVGELADGLPLPADGRMKTSDLHAAISARRDQVVQRLPKATADGRVTLALVEIHRKKAYTPRSTDPKFALRLGFRDAGRVTQFATNAQQVTHGRSKADDARSKKFESCWTDGLRQLGHRTVPDHRLGEAVPADTQYAALWLVRRRRDGPTRQADLVPIAVRVRPDAAAAERITGWDHRSGVWVPYPELLMRLAESAELPAAEITESPSEWNVDEPADQEEDNFGADAEPDGRTEQQRRALASTVQEILYGLRDRPTLLLLHAQNTRQLWPWLQNAHIQPDMIQLHGQPAQRIALQGSGLRVVRIRDHTGTETPQWWGHEALSRENSDTEEDRFGLPTGLWKPPGCGPRHRVFGSTSEKAGPGATVAVNASRWALRSSTRNETTVMTIDTDKLAWNPALLEITVAACGPDDDPELWAALSHRLRQSPGRAPLLALPLPLILASKAAEYVLPTTQDQPSEPDEDDGAVQLSFDLGVTTG